LRLSLWVGFVAALLSAVLGILLGIAAGFLGGVADQAVTWMIDLVMSLPHLVFQILIAFAFGGGARGVIAAVALTHWAMLARIVRAEAQRIKTSEYVLLSSKLGHSKRWIARHHLLPHLLPQFLVGLLLMFPHAISHEAALSFIGLGLTPHQPSMGIVLAESLRHLSTGFWWLAVFPGLALLLTVKAFDVLGEEMRILLTPRMRQDS
jgi:peptide/nickel transport system permease protein